MNGRSSELGHIWSAMSDFVLDQTLSSSVMIRIGRITVGAKTTLCWIVHAVIADGIRPSPDLGVVSIPHHYDARHHRLLVLHRLLQCGGRPVH